MDFSSLLSTRADDIEKPLPLPIGTYVWKVNKPHRETEMARGEYKVIEIPIVPVMPHEASDDVDPDALEAFGSLNQAANSLRYMFPTDPAKQGDVERTLYNLKKFLVDVLCVEAEEGATIKELLALGVGCEFAAQASHRQVEDNIYIDIKNQMPLG